MKWYWYITNCSKDVLAYSYILCSLYWNLHGICYKKEMSKRPQRFLLISYRGKASNYHLVNWSPRMRRRESWQSNRSNQPSAKLQPVFKQITIQNTDHMVHLAKKLRWKLKCLNLLESCRRKLRCSSLQSYQ